MPVPRFWREQAQRYRLMGSECDECHAVYFPPRGVCPKCRRESIGHMKPRQLSGRGRVLTYTVVHQPADGFELQVPYAIAIVELEEGSRVMAQIVDAEPYSVETGLEVEACFRRIREDGKGGVIYYGYKFRVARPATRSIVPALAEPSARRAKAPKDRRSTPSRSGR